MGGESVVLEVLGHALYATVWCGNLLIAKRLALGWLARLVGEVGWVVLGLYMLAELGYAVSSIVVWGLVFTASDLYGLVSWTRALQRAER